MTHRRRLTRSVRQARSMGISLAEVLIGLFITGLALAATAQLAVSNLNIVRTTMTSSETQRGFAKVSYLLGSEISEACVIRLLPSGTNLTTFQDDLNTPSNYPYPTTPCQPAEITPTLTDGTWSYPATPVCQDDDSDGVLSLVVPLAQPNGPPIYRVIQYRLTVNSPSDGFSTLTRVGPAVEASGRLSSTASDISIVSRRVVSFIPTITSSTSSADSCRAVSIVLQMNSAGASSTLRFRARVAEAI